MTNVVALVAHGGKCPIDQSIISMLEREDTWDQRTITTLPEPRNGAVETSYTGGSHLTVVGVGAVFCIGNG
jgi:hypothetical protein